MTNKTILLIIARLKEPSTYAGLAVLASLVGISPESFQEVGNAVLSVLAGIAAIVSIVMQEGKKND